MKNSINCAWPEVATCLLRQAIPAIILYCRQERHSTRLPDPKSPTHCELGKFPCGDLPTCLPLQLQCDGKKDCSNGADEANCGDNNGWADHLQSQVVNPALESAGIPRDCHLDMRVVPSVCQCIYTHVKCERVGLVSVPANLSQDVTRLSGCWGIGILERSQSSPTKLCLESTGSSSIRLSATELNQTEPTRIGSVPTGVKLTSRMEAGQQNLQHNLIESLQNNSLGKLTALHSLNLRGNRIRTLPAGAFTGLTNLGQLDLRFNYLQDLPSGVWCDHMPALLWLNFRNNTLKSIGQDTFTPLSSVWELNVSYNRDMILSRDLFFGLDNLTSLDLRGLEMPQDCQHSRVLLSLENLYFVYFDDFSSCRYALQARGCSPKSDGISSLKNMLALVFLRVVVWVLAFFTVLGNSFVILGRLLIKNENNVHSLFIRNLCAADLLMGVYLVIIASRDVMYRNEFIQHALFWQESVLCQFAGFLAMLSSEVSVLLLTYMSMERCLIIVFPFRTMEPSARQNRTCIACIWLIGFLIASLPFLIQDSTCFYGSSSVCFPLHLRSPYGQGWVYGAVVFIGLNMCAWFIILMCYCCMFISIQRTRMRTTGPPAHKADWIGWRFFFIVLTDSLCWIPTVVLKLLVLHGVNISETFNAVIAVVVLPINSSINPILYSISTSNFKDGSLRVFRTRGQSISRLATGNSSGNTFTMSVRASLGKRWLVGAKRLHVRSSVPHLPAVRHLSHSAPGPGGSSQLSAPALNRAEVTMTPVSLLEMSPRAILDNGNPEGHMLVLERESTV
ncbi:G-protein coupled receptor [Branchiostoma belcheri]|nr:G-protein coupled receptor [Branchiostoma belcheri]